jgi:hypothetical protein
MTPRTCACPADVSRALGYDMLRVLEASSRTYGGDEKRNEATIIPFTYAIVQVGTMMVDPLDAVSALPLAAIQPVSLRLSSLRCMINHGLTSRQ